MAERWDEARRCAAAVIAIDPTNAEAQALRAQAASAATGGEARGPLDGVRVLEFSLIFSAPYAGIHLSDLGAEVIKVEQPGGEPFRGQSTLIRGHSKTFQAMNRGKQSLVVDLHTAEGMEVIKRLVPTVDVVLINYRPGVAKRLGLGYEDLRKLRPDLIYAEITGFSPEGPLANRSASDMVAQAYGGATALDGKLDEDGAPVWPSLPAGDLPAGIATTLGITAALYHRQQTGEGQFLTVSLLRTVMLLLNYTIMVEPVNDSASRDLIREKLAAVRASGGSYKELIATREGMGMTGSPMSIYWRGYQASDGGLVMGALTKANRDAIRKVVGIEDDPTDGEDYDPTDEKNHVIVEEIKTRLRGIMRERTVVEWIDIFEKVGAPVAPVNLPEDLPDDPEGTLHFVDIEHGVTGPQRVVKPLVDFAKSPARVAGPAPSAGEHTDTVLQRAGFTDSEIEALRSSGAVG